MLYKQFYIQLTFCIKQNTNYSFFSYSLIYFRYIKIILKYVRFTVLIFVHDIEILLILCYLVTRNIVAQTIKMAMRITVFRRYYYRYLFFKVVNLFFISTARLHIIIEQVLTSRGRVDEGRRTLYSR